MESILHLCSVLQVMNERYPAIWIENEAAPGLAVELIPEENRLLIKKSEGFIQIWDFKLLQATAVPGAYNKWYLSSSGTRFPRLLVEQQIPGISGMKTKRIFGPLLLPGFSVAGFFALMIFLAGLFLWKGLPFCADFAAQQVPVEWEKKLGAEIKNQTLASLETDQPKTMLVKQLMKHINFADAQENGFGSPEIVVVKKDEFNAFALPGGTIVLYTGALEKVPDLPALLALIGHENGHVQGRHSLRTIARSMGLYAVASIFLGDFTGLAAVLVDNASSLQTLSYSRDFEREADEAAFYFLCRNGVPVNGLVRLMETMESEQKKSAVSVPGFLSSHPLTEERLATAKRLRQEASTCPVFESGALANSIFRQIKNH